MKFCLKPETPILYSAPQGFPRRLFYLKTALKRGQEKTQSETGIRRRTQRVLENHRLPVQNVVGTRSGPAAPGLHRDAGRPAGAGDGARAGDEPVPAPRGQAGAGQESMRTGNKHPSDKEAGVASPHAARAAGDRLPRQATQRVRNVPDPSFSRARSARDTGPPRPPGVPVTSQCTAAMTSQRAESRRRA